MNLDSSSVFVAESSWNSFSFLLFLFTKDLQNFSETWRQTVVKFVMKLARVIFKGNFREHLKSR